MASWSTRRKSTYLAVFMVLLVIAVGVPSFFAFYRPATCSDGKWNGSEHGVDCGGSCVRLCPADYSTPRVKWSYSMKIVPGIYNALAYIENPNQTVEAKNLSYTFKLYDNLGILVAEREGKTFVPAGQKFAVFENAIETGNRIPSKTTFEFTSIPEWKQGKLLSNIRTTAIDVMQESNTHRAEANIENITVDQSFSNIDAFIILYNKDDNRVAFSKTTINSIAPGEQQTLYFTWPMAFTEEVVRSEVIFVAKPN